ncbi:hypothetical protein E0765_04510 [Sulfuricurvum sp. IAE1]|jgi:chromosome segregation ATPase|uniref:hypothetical protein n=1 Tax=Sulfuricurvum sp. IAE1 TaxID=2546102 RepID=UPI0010540E90|nr:hypothetical protein [Sulfuricurvum sp. IAE1]MDD3769058.1 hypothetical protein [Sulfuricurvum sp.]MDX9965875.1 hypothetical protein [Sulfuricurvum sp.]TDA67174.1 hypothetical protein E0765_04510 [Sulfuricurvum sp. IAE1]
MLFNPTPLEKLETLASDLLSRYNTAKEELETLRQEIVAIRAHGSGKDDEIERLTAELRTKDAELTAKNAELAEKDAEIEAIIAKIESMLG